MAKSKSRVKKRAAASADRNENTIVIDEKAGLVFASEEELSEFFDEAISGLESEYQSLKDEADFSDEEQLKLEHSLEPTLDEPDEVWRDDKTFENFPVHIFIKEFEGYHYVALAYVSSDDEEPTFVLIHFPTKDPRVIQDYQRGELVFDERYRRAQPASIEGDALTEGDPLAIGLYLSMLKIRAEKDVPEADFQKFGSCREETIETADEIWKKTDMDGNILVTFIKEFPDNEVPDLYYVAVTQEDADSNVHALLFSFPTTDKTLVDRYRQGENLQAEEIVQESSH